MIVRLALTISAPVDRLWRALTVPSEVARWAVVEPIDVPAGYPAPGQHATWRDGDRVLHDVIVRVDPLRRLSSRLWRGPWLVLEDYLLHPRGRSTRLRAEWRGHPALAAGNDAAMRRLKRWCETAGHG